MCLYTTQKVPKIAQEDITCYKVLEICNPEWESESGRKRKKPVLRSVYYPDFKWNIDKLYRSRLVIQPSHLTDNYPVAKAFHSYETLESAKSYYQATFVQPCVIVRCIIPKGAKYCEGMHSDKQDGYASNQIIMEETLDVKDVFNRFDWHNYPFKVGQKIKTNKGEDIFQIMNIQPVINNQCRADLIVENCANTSPGVITTEYKKGTWGGADIELEILKD